MFGEKEREWGMREGQREKQREEGERKGFECKRTLFSAEILNSLPVSDGPYPKWVLFCLLFSRALAKGKISPKLATQEGQLKPNYWTAL